MQRESADNRLERENIDLLEYKGEEMLWVEECPREGGDLMWACKVEQLLAGFQFWVWLAIWVVEMSRKRKVNQVNSHNDKKQVAGKQDEQNKWKLDSARVTDI